MKLEQLFEAAKPIEIPYDKEFKKLYDKIYNVYKNRNWQLPPQLTHMPPYDWKQASPQFVRELNKLNDDDLLVYLHRYHSAFKYLQNPSHKIIMYALRREGTNLKYLPEMGIPMTDEFIKAAVRANGRSIGYVDNPTEEQMLIAVSQVSSALHNIFKPYNKNLTPGKPTQAVLDMAKKKNKAAFNDVMIKHGKFTDQEIDQAINVRGTVVTKIKNPSRDQILAGLKKSPSIIVSMAKKKTVITQEMIDTAIAAAIALKENVGWLIVNMITAGIKVPEKTIEPHIRIGNESSISIVQAMLTSGYYDVPIETLRMIVPVVIEQNKKSRGIGGTFGWNVTYLFVDALVKSGMNVPSDIIQALLDSNPYCLKLFIKGNHANMVDDQLIYDALTNDKIINFQPSYWHRGPTPYEDLLLTIYPDNALLQKKWIRYAEMRKEK